MTAPALPDFQRAIRLSQGSLDSATLSECHGVLCGVICRESGSTAHNSMHHLTELKLLVDPTAELTAVLSELFESTSLQLDDEDMGFELWLPDDEELLEERTICLAQWCEGFLAGLASRGEFEALSEEAAEAIDDLQQIAEAELTSNEDQEQENEEEEVALAEISEYVRVVALMMREEFRGPRSDDVIH
jgi:uncharacterized protein YgfB (UPF0149 family)